jgi:hypothetical protein
VKPAIRTDAYQQGVQAERDRIVQLLKAWVADDQGDFDIVLAQAMGYQATYHWCLCGHKSKERYQAPDYNPDVFCPLDNQRMTKVVRLP